VSYDYPRDSFIVSAATAYSPVQQVFISYGTQTNDSLLQMYGFVEADNPHDAYVMTSLLKWLDQLQAPCQERLDALNREGLLKSLQEVVITRKGFGADTLQALRYLLVPPSSSSSSSGGQKQQGLPAGSPSSYASPADAATEQKLGLVLVHACQQELSVLGAMPSKADAAAAAPVAAAGSSKGRRKPTAAAGSSSSNGGSIPAAAAAAAAAIAAAFRLEKQKVLLACLEQLTGETGGSAAAAAAAAGSTGGSSGDDAGAADAGMQAAAASKR
jgi:hypothetical protein